MAYTTDDYVQAKMAALAGTQNAALSLRAPSIKEGIEQQLATARANVIRLEELLQLIERNSDIERILTLMNR